MLNAQFTEEELKTLAGVVVKYRDNFDRYTDSEMSGTSKGQFLQLATAFTTAIKKSEDHRALAAPVVPEARMKGSQIRIRKLESGSYSVVGAEGFKLFALSALPYERNLTRDPKLKFLLDSIIDKFYPPKAPRGEKKLVLN